MYCHLLALAVHKIMSTRREFLLNCTTLAAGVAIAPIASWGAVSPLTEVSLDSISLAKFTELVNTTFTVIGGNGETTSLELTSVRTPPPAKASSKRPADAGNEKFSLTFQGSPDQLLGQNSYLFAHQNIGCFSIFIVPIVVADQGGCYYEAVFNRPSRGPTPVVSPTIGVPRNQRAICNQ